MASNRTKPEESIDAMQRRVEVARTVASTIGNIGNAPQRLTQAEAYENEVQQAHNDLTYLMDRLSRLADLTQYARVLTPVAPAEEAIAPVSTNAAIGCVEVLRSRVQAASNLVNSIIDTL